MALSKLAKLIQDNPKCFIYYTDNGEWTLYKSRKKFMDLERIEFGDDYGEAELANKLYDGDDYSGSGYAGELVTALAELLNIKVDSI